ncbi:MAG TPA: IPT/TIG domain-containing protein, partial [Myxococcales bacterium]|nr:IPT/TIG domain-containing protein [Myxococcales bacterium]
MTRFAFTLCLTLIGCHFNSSGWAPAIDAFKSTLSVTTGENALILRGLGFDPAGTLYIDGMKQPFIFVSGAEIDVKLPTAITAVSGTHQITFANTDGFVSPPVTLRVHDAAFHLDAVSPTQLDVGREQTLTFSGAGFLPAMYVAWGDGTKLATTLVSSTTLTAVVPAQLVAVPGNSSVMILTSGSLCNTSCSSQVVPVRIGIFGMRVVNQGATDLVWDSARDLIHCADSFASTHTFFSIDLQTTDVVASYAVPRGPRQLSLSSDGSSLYAVYYAGQQVVRFGMPGFTQATVLSGPMGVTAAAAAPGSPLSVAVSAQGKVAIYDDQTARAQQATVTAWSLLWTGDPGALYAMDDFGFLYSMPVTPSGVGQPLHLGP